MRYNGAGVVSTYGTGLVTVSPGAKKLLGVVVIVLLAYFVISDPNGSSGVVRDILGMLQEGAEAVITFLRSLFA